jgi:ubiquinone biosynthesis UbiH/UbiF/VisC/COQ6 family hydroxylase
MTLDIAIVGGGLVGGSLACALAGSGLRAAVIEPRASRVPPASGFDARVFALSRRSIRFLARIGAWAHVDAARVAPVREMQVFGDDGKARLEFNAYRSGLPELAAIVEESNLQRAMATALATLEGIEIHGGLGCESVDWEDARACLALTDGARLDARLVVAADGAESEMRSLAGIDVHRHAYGQQGVVANFSTGRPHGSVARQWFLRDGVLALLPLPGDHVSMVWSTGDDHAAELLAMAPGALAARVAQACSHCLGELQAAGIARAFPLRRMRAKSQIGPRLALVGDAAHNVHPLAGQGLNLGFADAEELARILLGRGVENDCGSRVLLRRFERARKEDVLAMEYITDGLQGLFASRLPGVAALRNAGLNLTDRIAPLKRYLVKRALG